MSRRTAIPITCGLFLFLTLVYAYSAVKAPYDSRWSIHTSLSLIEGSGGALDDYLPVVAISKFYAIQFVNGRPRTIFPIGVSVLVAPAVAAIALVDPSFKERLRHNVPDGLEKILASMLGAAASVVFFWLIFLKFGQLSIALATTFIFSFCTSIWSVATRALWQHGPLVLMLAIAMLLIQQARKKPALIQYASLPLAMAYLIRPTAAIPIVVLTAYVLAYYRAWFLRYLAWAALIAAPWIAFNFAIYGKILSHYYFGLSYSGSTRFAEAAAGNLVSPARGLFVYSPVLLFSLSGFLLSLRDKEQRALHLAYGIIVAGMFIAISLIPAWWAGHSFGPRYMTDLLPFLVYFTAFNFNVAASWRPAVMTAMGVLVAISVAIHAQGALGGGPWRWNATPQDVDFNPSRLWDWRDLQFLASPPKLQYPPG